MRKIFAITFTLCALLLTLTSCQGIEEQYADKAIYISVKHYSRLEVEAEHDVFLENIREGESYTLPNGEANSYIVTVTITDLTKDKIQLTFSEPMTANDTQDGNEITTFELSLSESRKFSTPTTGGGDSFAFSVVDKSDIPAL